MNLNRRATTSNIMKALLGCFFAGCTGFVRALAAPQTQTTEATFGNPWATSLEIFLSLGLIVVMAVFLIRFLAKRAQVEQRGGIQVVAARQLAPNKSVQVVQWEDRTFVVGVGENVTLLSDITGPLDLEGPGSQDTDFADLLSDSLQRLRQGRTAQREERETD